MTSIAEEVGTAQAPAAAQPKATKRAHAGARRAHVAPKKSKSGKRASQPKKAPTGGKKAGGARDGSKAAKIIELLKRPEGATLAQLMKATSWQAHSVRGYLSGTLRKKMGLAVSSTRDAGGERHYSITA